MIVGFPSAHASMQLFGSIALKGPAFPQWSRFAAEIDDALMVFDDCAEDLEACHQPRLTAFLDALQRLADLPPMVQLHEVNRLANALPYRSDAENFGRTNHWAGPLEFLQSYGDCEDYAIFKYALLRWLGFGDDALRVVLVKQRDSEVGHAVLAVALAEDVFILDNEERAVLQQDQATRYRPITSFNQTGLWGHFAARPTDTHVN